METGRIEDSKYIFISSRLWKVVSVSEEKYVLHSSIPGRVMEITPVEFAHRYEYIEDWKAYIEKV